MKLLVILVLLKLYARINIFKSTKKITTVPFHVQIAFLSGKQCHLSINFMFLKFEACFC